MKLTPVKELPSASHGPRNAFFDVFEEFEKMDCDIVMLDKSSYKSAQAMYSSVWKAVQRHHRPIKVAMRKGEVYLYKIK